MRRALALFVILTHLLALAASATPRKDGHKDSRENFTYLLYCPWFGFCYLSYFYTEDVEVVAEYGRLDLSEDFWGVRGDCEDCLWLYVNYDDPAPEPIEQSECTCGGSGNCDERDLIRVEYLASPMKDHWVPQCSDFSTSGGSANFYWSELNHHPGNEHVPLSALNTSIFGKLEATRSAYDDQPITMKSGYRCVNGNDHEGGAPLSRHMFGDAADMIGIAPWTETEWGNLKDAALASGFTWTSEWDDYADHHLHADFRQ